MTTNRVVEILEDKNTCSECACNMSDSITCNDCGEVIKIAIEAVKDIEKYKKAIEEIKTEILSLKGDNFPNGYYVKIIDKHLKGVKS